MPRAVPILCFAAALAAGDATVPGTAVAPHPTTWGISLEWPFSGDADGDGRVAVRYRSGGGAWHGGMALFRVPAGDNSGSGGASWGNCHRGSLFDLEPATTYEVELTLTDPDGGGAVRTLSVTTRAVPAAMAGATVRPATPATFAAAWAAAAPGDILDLAAGTYPGFTWDRDGAPGQPIVLRSTAGAVIDGNIDMFGRHDVILDGLTVEGRIRFNGSARIAVTGCHVDARADRGSGDGIVSYTRSEDCYVADCTVVGTSTWNEAAFGASGSNLGEGICLTGPGHVIRNNRVRAFRDGVSLMEFTEAVEQVGIDILENDISQCCDDGIEADASAGNCRVFRNRLTDCFMGVSSQPGEGGPLYIVRNVMYNVVFEPFKLHNGTVGDVIVHNTVVKAGDAFGVFSGAGIYRLWMRDNLLLGGSGGTYNGYDIGAGRVADVWDLDTASASLDWDGYGSSTGFVWRLGPNAPATGLATMRSQSSEAHATEVSLAAFAATIAAPAPTGEHSPPDLRLAAAGAAVDAGMAIPGLDDGYAGSAPDLGAYELGQEVPHYGPRSAGGGGGGGGGGSGASNDGGGSSGGGCGAGAGSALGLLALAWAAGAVGNRKPGAGSR